MLANPLKKNKIFLPDYPYQKDIEFRLIMSELTVFEVDILTEIVHGSLKTRVPQLAEYLDVDHSKLLPTLEKLQRTKLFHLDRDSIVVDKEIRKYWENQIPKFNDDFRADMEFLKDLLNKVPIHVLPVWYSIPRTSDDIFSSIIEKYLLTPKIYRRYLDDLAFDEPILNEIMNDVFSAPDFKVRAKTLIEKYALPREKFEEFMLQLEFNLVCCLSYNLRDDRWEEVITPFSEWRQYLRFQRDSSPKQIEDKSAIKRKHPHDFGFVQDVTRLIQLSLKKPTAIVEFQQSYTLPPKLQIDLFSHLPTETLTDEYVSTMIGKALQLQLIEIKENQLHSRKIAAAWTEKHIQEQAIALYRCTTAQSKAVPGGYIDRNLRETEKCLKRVANQGWIYFEDFSKVCTAPLGDNEPVTLRNKGKRWKYQIPEYSKEDILTLQQYIFGTLFHSGIVATGVHDGKLCFSVTPFGRMTLD
jgi:hypothetical protein